MEMCLLAAALGAVALLWLPVLPDVQYVLLVALVLMPAALRWRRLWPVICCLSSLAWACWQAQAYLAERPPFFMEDKPFKVEVQVQGLSDYTAFGQRIRVKPLQLRSRLDYRLPRTTSWQLTTTQATVFRPGQIWLMTVSLRRPHGAASPGAFDYQQWLMSEGISATGKITRAQLTTDASWSIDEWRLQIRERVQQQFPGDANAAIGLALLTGDRALVPDSVWDLYSAAGVSHLMAISGPHVLLAATMIAVVFTRILGLWPGLFLRLPVQQLKLPLILTVALVYGCLAGLSLPTQRTLMMVGISIVLLWFRHESSMHRIVLRAFVLIVLWQPLSVHAIGFWLSFGAVALLLLWSGWQRQEDKFRAFGRLQLWLTLALAPLTLCFFGRLSLVSPLTNAFAIPVVGLGIVPLELFGLALGSVSAEWQMGVWHLASLVVAGLNSVLTLLTYWPASQQFWVLTPLVLLFLTAALLVLLLPRTIVPRPVALVLLLPVLFALPPKPSGTLGMSVLDVGQGLSVLLQTQHHSLLYDTGANAGAGERIINPYLRWSGVRRLDVLMISHNDKDHTGGADAVVAQMPITQAYYSAPPEGYHLPVAVDGRLCQAGQYWHWDGVDFEVLSPLPGLKVKKDNDRSCVLKVSGNGFSVLLTGDIELPTEQALIQAGSPLKTDVLVLAHHGSKTSSGPAFLAAAQPKLAIVSAGYHNQFGHPSPPVIQRLQAAHIDIDNTITQGTLRYHFQPQQNLHKEAWRDIGHYWLNSP